MEVPAPTPTVRPREDARVAGTRTRGVRPQTWEVTSGYWRRRGCGLL